MRADGLGDLVADRVDGRERRQRILEDHRDAAAAHAPRARRRPSPISSWPSSRTEPLDDARAVRQQPCDRERRRRLAASPTRRRCPSTSPRAELEVDPAHGVDVGLAPPGTSPPGRARTAPARVCSRALPLVGSSASRRPSPTRLTARTVSDEQHRREREQPGLGRRRGGPVRDQRAERDVGRLHAEAEVRQAGLGDDRRADVDRRVDDQQRGDVREDVAEDDRCGRARPCSARPARTRARAARSSCRARSAR